MDLERLKSASHTVDIAHELGLNPKKQGRDFVARCPNHHDTGRPNLVIYPDGVKCFSCGWRADVIDLAAKVQQSSRGEAIRWLAGRLGWQANGGQDAAHPRSESKRRPTHVPTPSDKPGPQVGPPPGAEPAPAPVSPSPAAAEARPPGGYELGIVLDGPPLDPATLAPVIPPAAAGEAGEASPPQEILTLIWPADALVATIAGHWQRLPDGRIEAAYTRAELALCLAIMQGATAGAAANPVPTAPPAPAAPAAQPTMRVAIYQALLSYTVAADGSRPAPGALWLRDHKGINLETQAACGVCWLEDWQRADRELKASFGVAALHDMGLLTSSGELHFRRHRLLFPFWLQVGERRAPDYRRAPVYVQGRNIEARDKRERFCNPSGEVPLLYNFAAAGSARETGRALFICEGVTDTLTLLQSGRLACGIVGAQGFKAAWLPAFRGLHVYLAFDPDAPGQAAAQQVARRFLEARLPAPKIISLPAGQDVTDFFTGQRSKDGKVRG